jgi:hypothetical protein
MVRSCEIFRSAPDARRDGGQTRVFPQGDFRTEIAILYYIWLTSLVGKVRKSLGRLRCRHTLGEVPAVHLLRREPSAGMAGRGQNEWAREAAIGVNSLAGQLPVLAGKAGQSVWCRASIR